VAFFLLIVFSSDGKLAFILLIEIRENSLEIPHNKLFNKFWIFFKNSKEKKNIKKYYN
jgi:hypothetical protein